MFQLSRKYKSRTTSRDRDGGRPRQSGCLSSRPVTFCPCLAAGLALIRFIVDPAALARPDGRLGCVRNHSPSRTICSAVGTPALLGDSGLRSCGCVWTSVEIVTIQMPDQAIILLMAARRLIHLVARYSTSH